MAKQEKKLEVTLVKSFHGRKPGHKECVFGLGIRRMHQTVTVADTPENRGMINRVNYLVTAKEA
jgi:large subunit ribosomal protein L30